MTFLESALRRAVRDLNALKVPWALVGGFAVAAHGHIRTTFDIDFVVAVDDKDAEAVVHQMLKRGYAMATLLEDQETGHIATVRLTSPIGGSLAPFVDLLIGTSGIEQEIIQRAVPTVPLRNLTVPVATLSDILALKVLAESDYRRQDRVDIQSLLPAASKDDIDATHTALALITERGFNRGKDLRAVSNRSSPPTASLLDAAALSCPHAHPHRARQRFRGSTG